MLQQVTINNIPEENVIYSETIYNFTTTFSIVVCHDCLQWLCKFYDIHYTNVYMAGTEIRSTISTSRRICA